MAGADPILAVRAAARESIDYTPTEPLLVVEVDADICFEQGRWRHATAFRRVRGDLQPTDVPSR